MVARRFYSFLVFILIGIFLMSFGSALDITGCGTLDQANTIYELQNNVSTTGICFTIAADNVTLDGNGYNVSGDINGNGVDEFGENAKNNLTLLNISVTGTVTLTGAENSRDLATGGSGGAITLSHVYVSGEVNSRGGSSTFGGSSGAISIYQSIISTVNANGGDGSRVGRIGGTIFISNSTVGNIYSSGGTGGGGGARGGAGGSVTLVSSTSQDIYANGDDSSGGPINLTNSNASNLYAIGGYYYYGSAGSGGNVYLTNSIINSAEIQGGSTDGAYAGGSGGNITLVSSSLNLSNFTINLAEGVGGSSNGTRGSLTLNNSGFDNSYGKIKFSYFSTQNTSFSNILSIGNNSAYVNSSNYPDYNVSANISLYNTPYSYPKIMKDGAVCTDCVLLSSSGTNHTFSVSSWSNYTIQDAGSLTACGNLNVANTIYTLQNDVSTTGTCFTITVDNVTLDLNGHNITGGNNAGMFGIAASNRRNITILNGLIEWFGKSSGGSFGVYLGNTSNSFVSNLTFLNNFNGLYLISASNNNTFQNITSKFNNYSGVDIVSSLNNCFYNLTTLNNDYSIRLESSSNNNTFSNVTSANNLNEGIYLASSSNNNFSYLTAYNNSASVYFATSSNNIFNEVDISNSSWGVYISLVSNNNLFYNLNSYSNTNQEILISISTGSQLIYNDSFGEIRLKALTSNVEGDLRFGPGRNIQIINNSAYLNSTAIPALNVSANISLYNTPYSYPKIMKDGAVCTDCVLLSSSGTNHTFSVSSWSNYTLADASLISSCGTLDQANTIYELQNNVSTTGICFTIAADNVTLDGNGYHIGGNISASGVGVGASARTNFTLINATVQGSVLANGIQGEYLGGGGVGGHVNVTDSNVSGVVFSLGGSADNGIGGSSGNITIIRSEVGAVSSISGDGYNGAYSGNIIVINSTTANLISSASCGGVTCYSAGYIYVSGSFIGSISSAGGGGDHDSSTGSITVINSTGYSVSSSARVSIGDISILNSSMTSISALCGDSGFMNGCSVGAISINYSNISTLSSVAGAGAVYGGVMGAINIFNSNATSITATGGYGEIYGGSTPAISITSSSIRGTIFSTGANGGEVFGGSAGAITFTNSNVSLSVFSTGGNAAIGGGSAATITFLNSRILLPFSTSLISGTGGENGKVGDGSVVLNQTTFYNSYGQIKWGYAVTQNIFNNTRIQIINNSAYLNSTALPELNTSANITFYGLPIKVSEMYNASVLFHEGSGKRTCSNCNILSNSDFDSSVLFNVSDFGNSRNYSVGGVDVVALNSGWNSLSFILDGVNPSSKNISVTAGWNLIGFASNESLNTSLINFTNNSGNSYTWDNAVANGKVMNDCYFYNSESKTFEVISNLTKGKGYWIYSREAGNLTLPSVFGSQIGESYPLTDLTFVNSSGSEKNITNADASGWINISRIYGYNSATNFTALDYQLNSSNSWEGYVFWSNQNLSLLRQD